MLFYINFIIINKKFIIILNYKKSLKNIKNKLRLNFLNLRLNKLLKLYKGFILLILNNQNI